MLRTGPDHRQELRDIMEAGVSLMAARNLHIANLESAKPPVATYGSPSGARIALWRETGNPDSRDAFVMSVLAEGSR